MDRVRYARGEGRVMREAKERQRAAKSRKDVGELAIDPSWSGDWGRFMPFLFRAVTVKAWGVPLREYGPSR
jgi:hypothetical protein